MHKCSFCIWKISLHFLKCKLICLNVQTVDRAYHTESLAVYCVQQEHVSHTRSPFMFRNRVQSENTVQRLCVMMTTPAIKMIMNVNCRMYDSGALATYYVTGNYANSYPPDHSRSRKIDSFQSAKCVSMNDRPLIWNFYLCKSYARNMLI